MRTVGEQMLILKELLDSGICTILGFCSRPDLCVRKRRGHGLVRSRVSRISGEFLKDASVMRDLNRAGYGHRQSAPSYLGRALTVISLCLLAARLIDAQPVSLRCENRQNPLGIDASSPRFSWQSDNKEHNWTQSAYRILVGTSEKAVLNGKPDVWDSGKKMSAESVGIVYGGPALESRTRYYWSVSVWNGSGKESAGAAPAWWETGLLSSRDWRADWITRRDPEEAADLKGIHWIWASERNAFHETSGTTASFRLVIDAKERPTNAALYVVARGNFVARVNGRIVDEKAHWQQLGREDITGELKPGKNTVEIEITAKKLDGAFFPESPDGNGVPAGVAALVKVQYRGDAVERFPTSTQWQVEMQGGSSWTPAEAVADLNDARLTKVPLAYPEPVAQFRKEFKIDRPVSAARLYISAAGSYQAFINGHRAGSDVLTPGYTDFGKRIYYQTYDVTASLRQGRNVLGALLGPGWYGSPMTWMGQAYLFAPPPLRLIAQLEIEHPDGTRETIATGPSWRTAQSPILNSTIYGGETFDARLERDGWDTTSYSDTAWQPAEKAQAPPGALVAQIDRPPQVILQVRAKSVTPHDRSYIFDLGQNIAGWATLKVSGPAGTRVRMRFAEILNPDGSIYTKNLRGAEATDTYVLRGSGTEIYSPHFTFHGFRYVEVSGLGAPPTLDTITGDVVSSVDDAPTGRLNTSSDLVNHMWEVGLWGQRANFLSVPTDCPQRDERLGWMGDAGVFWRTGAYNFDTEAFSEKFMHDVSDAQTSAGAFTNVSPDQLRTMNRLGVPGWGDAGIIVPWTTWIHYGDVGIIRQNWDAMQRWMQFIEADSPGYLRKRDWIEGDWLAPDNRTPKDLIATAYWAMISRMMSEMAHAIGKEDDAARYAELYKKISTAFQLAYISEDGHVKSDTQTSYVLALQAGLIPERLRATAVSYLAKDILARQHLSTGFLGTPFLLYALSENGRPDLAYQLLLTTTYPSWGYMLSKGATTWWERWNSDTGNPAMNSFNHYAFGSVVAWVYRSVAGIDTDRLAPGFHSIVIHPHLDPRITHAHGEYDSVYGTITTDWHSTATGTFSLTVSIPANTAATVYLPVVAGARVLQDGQPVQPEKQAESWVVHIGSGSYHFDEQP